MIFFFCIIIIPRSPCWGPGLHCARQVFKILKSLHNSKTKQAKHFSVTAPQLRHFKDTTPNAAYLTILGSQGYNRNSLPRCLTTTIKGKNCAFTSHY